MYGIKTGDRLTGQGLYGIEVTGEFTGRIRMHEVGGLLYPVVQVICRDRCYGGVEVMTFLDVYLVTVREG